MLRSLEIFSSAAQRCISVPADLFWFGRRCNLVSACCRNWYKVCSGPWIFGLACFCLFMQLLLQFCPFSIISSLIPFPTKCNTNMMKASWKLPFKCSKTHHKIALITYLYGAPNVDIDMKILKGFKLLATDKLTGKWNFEYLWIKIQANELYSLEWFIDWKKAMRKSIICPHVKCG